MLASRTPSFFFCRQSHSFLILSHYPSQVLLCYERISLASYYLFLFYVLVGPMGEPVRWGTSSEFPGEDEEDREKNDEEQAKKKARIDSPEISAHEIAAMALKNLMSSGGGGGSPKAGFFHGKGGGETR